MRTLLFLLCAALFVQSPAVAAEKTAGEKPAPATNTLLLPGPDDRIIAQTTAQMLETCHYLHLPLDAKISDKFLTSYLNTLDPQHLHFLQSDIAEFDQFRTNLGALTKAGDTRPAYIVFNRYMQRLSERTTYSEDLLRAGPLDFTSAEEMPLSRKTAPYPKDMTEAKELWRQRLRYDYLQEKLSREGRVEIARQVLSRHNPFALGLYWTDFNDDISLAITKRYNRILRNFRDWESDKVLEEYLTALGLVYDPHTDYMDKADLENFYIQMTAALEGIGATLQMNDDGYTTVVQLVPAGPADKSKQLKPNDRIVAVAQGTNEPVDVVDMPLNHVVEKIRGAKGTEVRLTIIPGDAVDPSKRVVVSIVRDQIKLEEQQAKGSVVELPGPDGKPLRLGVIDLPSFYGQQITSSRGRPHGNSTTEDVLHLLEKLKQEDVKGVILDLRHNGGGLLEEAVNLTGLFIKEGPVVQVSHSDGPLTVLRDVDPDVQYDGPLVVLTSRFSASASEIVAGALQDYGRAVVVGGKSTHGKGTVQSLNQLIRYLYEKNIYYTNDLLALGALKYTTNKFYRVNGSSTELQGVEPDVVLPSTYDYMDVLGETALENAMARDTTNSAVFEKLNRVQPFLAELNKRSAARVAAGKDFSYVREDIERVKKVMGDKNISLNEAGRLKEAEDNEARQRAREEELKGRKWPDEKIYEFTLTQADNAGLPQPLIVTNGTVMLPGSTKGVYTVVNPDDNTITNYFRWTNGAMVSLPRPNAVKGVPATNEVKPTVANATDDATASDEDAAAKTTNPAALAPEERVFLVEAEHILADYISLLHAAGPLTADRQANTGY